MELTNSFKYRKLKNCKCFKIRKTSRLITQIYDKRLKPVGLKITQFSILSFIATGKEKTLIELADELFMDRTTLTRGLSVLKKKKLIKNIQNNDSRKKIMILTDQGIKILNSAIPLWEDAEEEILEESKKFDISIF